MLWKMGCGCPVYNVNKLLVVYVKAAIEECPFLINAQEYFSGKTCLATF